MSDSAPAPSRRRFGFVALFVAALVGLVGGGLGGAALAHGGFGRHFGHWGHWGHHDRGPIDPAHAQEHVQWMVGHLAREVDATAEQQQKLMTIGTALVKDLLPAHEKIRAAHARAVELFRAPQIDRAALEALRAEQITLVDDVSKRLTQGLADAAEVLTPQQRAKLAEHWQF